LNVPLGRRDVAAPYPDLLDGLSVAERYLVSWRYGHRANLAFDEAFYWNSYDDVRASAMPPLIHFLTIGRKQQRPINRNQLGSATADMRQAFDAAYYRSQTDLPAYTDPIVHYLTVGRFEGLNPAPGFSPLYYLQAYPDVARAAVEPFTHYVRHGKAEGRFGQPDFFKNFVRGKQVYNADRPTIVLATHDATRTGAPLVTFELARHFSEDCNVFIFSSRKGELIDHFAEHAVQVNFGQASPCDPQFFLDHLKKTVAIDAVLMNSVESSDFAPAALHCGVPSVILIHEFAEYTKPAGKVSKAAASADRVVVPARLILASLQQELKFHFGAPAINVEVRPQGIMSARPSRSADDPDEDLSEAEILSHLGHAGTTTPIVLGAGFVHMRKGVELFVQAAHEVHKHVPDVRFVWAGPGYEPEKDTNYSVWLRETIRRLKLEKTVFFLPQQANLDRLYALSSVFFLSSRMDPFPSVVLEAMEAGKQVVCFDKSTGSAELFTDNLARGTAVEYANVDEAAHAIVKILKSDPAEAAEINRRLVRERFQFADYVAFLKQQIVAAKNDRKRLTDACDTILETDAFDAEFHDGEQGLPVDRKRACLDYVSRHVKGLTKFNPRPGFSDNLYRSRTGLPAGKIPLEDALLANKGGNLPTTHTCVSLIGGIRPPRGVPTALHLHIHYPELACEFVARLNAARAPIDLFITTTDQSKMEELTVGFADYRHGTVQCLEVENRGRDLAPFLVNVKGLIHGSKYEIVGHLHAKRSLAIDRAMGDRWRAYLLDTLLGDGLNHLLGLFGKDQKLGLVFAEDRHVMGWSENHDLAQKLAARMAPRPALPSHPYFPLGTMFWARPPALESLWALNFTQKDFPAEPVPGDGTVLHAIERMLPSCVEAAGYTWCTVYDGRAW
jgi:glycosyltransferase involved in cell wall biosynthesis